MVYIKVVGTIEYLGENGEVIPDPGPGELLVEVHATAITADELTWPESGVGALSDLGGPAGPVGRPELALEDLA